SVLEMDCAAAAERIESWFREAVGRSLRRRGAVVGVSGGIDSAVCGALAARALGPSRVQALLMPERDSSGGSTARGKALCELFGIPYHPEAPPPALQALGCSAWRDRAIARLFPEYKPGDRFKITVAGDVLGSDRLNYFTLVVELSAHGGKREPRRMPMDVYL